MTVMRTLAAAAAVATLAGAAAGQPVSSMVLVGGLTNPLFMASPPGDYARLFIVEQRGSGGTSTRADIRIYKFATGMLNTSPFLSITGLGTSSEQGLLGLAFDPDYANNGYFYVNYTASGGTAGITRIVRYQVSANPDVANAASATILLTQDQPFNNHNAGWLAFGPDGYLYASLGDGGNACDPNNNAQNLTTYLGKMLRLDVSTAPYAIPPTNPFFGNTSVRQEIWAYGLRNPWRCSFDRQTGDLWIADVGQNAREEINFQPAATAPPFTARHYGWHCREGFFCASASGCGNPPSGCPSGCASAAFTDPIFDYGRVANVGGPCGNNAAASITGGYVYRGCAMPELRGTYFFADYCQGKVWSLRYSGGVVTQFTDRTAQLNPAGGSIFNSITSFGEDAFGEMYFCRAGTVYKIVPPCWANCDASTTAPVLNVLDFNCFLNRFAAQDCYANCDSSTTPPALNVLDFNCFLNKFAGGCP
jgi:hypothetical protein